MTGEKWRIILYIGVDNQKNLKWSLLIWWPKTICFGNLSFKIFHLQKRENKFKCRIFCFNISWEEGTEVADWPVKTGNRSAGAPVGAKMFTCIACTKQTTDDDGGDGAARGGGSSTPSSKEAVKSLTTQVGSPSLSLCNNSSSVPFFLSLFLLILNQEWYYYINFSILKISKFCSLKWLALIIKDSCLLHHFFPVCENKRKIKISSHLVLGCLVWCCR